MKKIITLTISTLLIVGLIVLVYFFINPPYDYSVPPPPSVCYENFEQFAQAIKDGSFLEQGYYQGLYQSVKDTMLNTNIIKPLINGAELDFYNENDWNNVTVYYPLIPGDPQGYLALYKHPNCPDHILFKVKYILSNTSTQTFPENEKANYDAVINGEKVRIRHFTHGDKRQFGIFQYKNMYQVELMTYDKELFDIVFNNLTIEEISVK